MEIKAFLLIQSFTLLFVFSYGDAKLQATTCPKYDVNLLLHLITLFAQFIQQKKIHTHWRNVVEEHIAISRKIKITVNVKKQSTYFIYKTCLYWRFMFEK